MASYSLHHQSTKRAPSPIALRLNTSPSMPPKISTGCKTPVLSSLAAGRRSPWATIFPVPITRCPRAAWRACAAVSASTGDLGLVPAFATAGAGPWWTALEFNAAPKIIARLPFVERANHPAAMPVFALSRAAPDAMVLGVPRFDASAPQLRVQGRRVSNGWANLETLWAGIGDSLRFSAPGRAIAPLFDTRMSAFGPSPTTEAGQRVTRSAADAFARVVPEDINKAFLGERKLGIEQLGHFFQQDRFEQFLLHMLHECGVGTDLLLRR